MRRDEQDGGERDEFLSALLDGELSGEDCARTVERLLRDPRLQAQWSRYHAARSALERSGAGCVGPAFAARVRQALADEPTILAPAEPASWRLWGRPIAGLALAATVAVAALAGLLLAQPAHAPAPGDAAVVADLDAGNAPAPGAGELAPAAYHEASPAARQAELRRRLALYLVSHSEYAQAGEMPGVLRYSRFAGFNAGQ